MLVYIVINLVNDKVYIGQTIGNLNIRKTQHYSATRLKAKKYVSCFHRAIKKYGEDVFEWKVLRLCNNINELNAWEQYYILYYDSMNVGYNLQSGGCNYVVTEKTKKRLREKHSDVSGKNNPMYGTIRKGKDGTFYGKKHTIEARKKIGENRTYAIGNKHCNYGKPMSEEQKEKLRKANIGKKHSLKTRLKMSESAKKRGNSNRQH